MGNIASSKEFTGGHEKLRLIEALQIQPTNGSNGNKAMSQIAKINYNLQNSHMKEHHKYSQQKKKHNLYGKVSDQTSELNTKSSNNHLSTLCLNGKNRDNLMGIIKEKQDAIESESKELKSKIYE